MVSSEPTTGAVAERRSSYEYDDLLACGHGKLFGPGNAQLPLPPMLMFDRIAAISEAGGAHGIHAFWHGRILHGTLHFRDRGIIVITSENYDGEWIARVIHRFGFGTARGSSSRGARKALLQLVKEARSHATAFTVDGPRGPARVAQPGAVWLSKATGNPVIPFHAEAAAHWSLRSWDRTQIPKPFTTVALVFGEPFTVPRDADDDALEQYRVRLEQELTDAERRCFELLKITR